MAKTVDYRDIEIVTEEDPDPDTSYLEQEGFEDARAEYSAGDLSYIGLWAQVEVEIGDTMQTIRSRGIWGVEDDRSHAAKRHQEELADEESAELVEILREMGFKVTHAPRGRSAHRTGALPGRDDIDEHAVTELQLYADNDSTLYRNSYIPVVRNMIKMKRRGVYDHERAIDGFMYHADRSAKAYAREFGGEWHKIFNRPTRRQAALEWTDQFEQQYDDGELEGFVPDPSTTMDLFDASKLR